MKPRPAPGRMTPDECRNLFAPVLRAHRLVITSLVTAYAGTMALVLKVVHF